VVIGLLGDPGQARGVAHPRAIEWTEGRNACYESRLGYEQHMKRGQIAYETWVELIEHKTA